MKTTLILFCFLFLSAPAIFAQKTDVFVTSDGAIKGYDPVAYFKENKPVKGDQKFSTDFNGVKWVFSSQENLDAFKMNPEKYVPQFGGFCAYGTAEGHKSPTSPEAFTIVDDKLYLNYNMKVKDLWNVKQKENIEKANKNWETLKTPEHKNN